MNRLVHVLTLGAAFVCSSCSSAEEPAAQPGASAAARATSVGVPTRRALLVACGRYPALPKELQLHGPPNDVKLLADLLEKNQNFRFPQSEIVKLADNLDAAHRPTRANILREFDALAKVAGPGDQILIMLGGHGTQQPDNNPNDPNDSEPDGQDEVFLPGDFERRYDTVRKTIPNAITDDEMGQKLTAIREKGAFVWIIFDCCHSGTMIRGADDETPRHVPVEDLIPADVLANVKPVPVADGSRGAGDGEDSTALADAPTDGLGGLVAIYAALPTEKTYDDGFPQGAPVSQQSRHGILTFAICQILERASGPLTYTELVERIRQQYAQWRRAGGPTPFVAGPDREKEILGERSWPGRSMMRLETVGSKLEITAGSLAGLSPGAILAVLPLNAAEGAAPLGYLKVADCTILRATAVKHEFAGIRPPEKFPADVRLEVVRVDFGARKVRVASPSPAESQLLTPLTAEANPARDVVEIVADPKQADWLVRVDAEQGWLVPAAGWSVPRKSGPVERDITSQPAGTFGPYPLGDKLGQQLGDTFSAIARAQNLLALSEPTDGDRLSKSMRVDLTVTLHQGIDDEKGKKLDLARGKIALRDGELLGFTIANRGRKPVDVTLLFVNSGFGIKAWYPKDGDLNRLAADEQVGPPDINFARVTSTTLGLEHMVLIAAASKGAPLDFTWLAQPTLQAARSVPGVRGEAFDSPLGQLLESAAYAPGTTRDADAVEVRQSCIRTLSWKVE